MKEDTFETSRGREFMVFVKYESNPICYCKCAVFKHLDNQCEEVKDCDGPSCPKSRDCTSKSSAVASSTTSQASELSLCPSYDIETPCVDVPIAPSSCSCSGPVLDNRANLTFCSC